MLIQNLLGEFSLLLADTLQLIILFYGIFYIFYPPRTVIHPDPLLHVALPVGQYEVTILISPTMVQR